MEVKVVKTQATNHVATEELKLPELTTPPVRLTWVNRGPMRSLNYAVHFVGEDSGHCGTMVVPSLLHFLILLVHLPE